MKLPRIALPLSVSLLLAGGMAHATPPGAMAPGPERDRKELRLVEILRIALQSKSKPDQAAADAMANELATLLSQLSGVDLKDPPPDAQERVVATQRDILARRDPGLLKKLTQATELYACRTKQTEAQSTLRVLAANGQASGPDWYKTVAADLKDLVAESKRYDYAVVEASASAVRVRATGRGDMVGDVWELEANGEPQNTANACQKLQPRP